MKTTILKTNNTFSNALKLVSILFILALSTSNLSAQTAVKNSGSTSIILPIVHYQQKQKSVTPPSVKVYSVLAAKKFPIIESGEKFVLEAKNDSEDLNYDDASCKTNTRIDTETKNTSLVLNYKIQKNTNA